MSQISQNSSAGRDASAAKPSGIGTIQGVSVVASVLLPIVAAYIVFYTGVGMPTGTINQGELLQPPVNINQLTFTDGDGAPLQLGEGHPKWRYLILPGAECAAECEQLLYTSRQVHVRLGEKADRVERLLVTATPLTDEEQEKLRREHPRLRIVQQPPESLLELQQQTALANIAETKLLLIDQRGFAMMAYDNHHSGNELLKDIKRLLKYSYEK
ncbi:hypothetical protein SAMN04487965_1988 [Microbulbifer donghaiensis]|uniref:Cytochrome oxidase Cu insertion factor, SCO1/SenC/PrrC family n=1 Tax=Microbulbifer donghaiensis TaxID=494016 RepID=A0A1M5AVZ3_9GAMM|nr:hypothetical protein [Microbulbifer donghaiensis]SHF34399.1 hypothetical protein SAMN04487965_1988 [Microbulbifer donghaiensis]